MTEKLNASARLDVGGFGAGSRIAVVNSEPLLNYRINKRVMGMAGWKFMSGFREFRAAI